jgi:hypothetical protein
MSEKEDVGTLKERMTGWKGKGNTGRGVLQKDLII